MLCIYYVVTNTHVYLTAYGTFFLENFRPQLIKNMVLINHFVLHNNKIVNRNDYLENKMI